VAGSAEAVLLVSVVQQNIPAFFKNQVVLEEPRHAAHEGIDLCCVLVVIGPIPTVGHRRDRQRGERLHAIVNRPECRTFVTTGDSWYLYDT